MTQQELFKILSERGAFLAPPAPTGQINLVNINLQNLRIATLPVFMLNIYKQCGGMNLGSGYIFGPSEFKIGNKHPVPNILEINRELTNIKELRGKTVFGRNDLFWFTFDSLGNCAMMDNTGLNILRKYDDPHRAIFECLIGGKF
jgi:hypothetical protein